MMNETNDKHDSFGSDLNLRNQIENYLKYWKWFVLSIIICLTFAFLKLSFTRSEFRTVSSVKIKDDTGRQDSKLSIFEDLGILGKSKDLIEDEIELLKSRSLISKVVQSLDLNIQFFTNKSGLSKFLDDTFSMSTNYFERERYTDPPLKINFFETDSISANVNTEFYISVISPTEYIYTDKFKVKKSSFGEKINTSALGEIIITPNFGPKAAIIGTDIMVDIKPIGVMVYRFSKGLEIEPKSDFSNILELRLTNSVRRKSEDFLTELINQYNDRSIKQKEFLTKSTSDFVNTRLAIIEEELSDIDLTAEKFKTKYRISDVVSEAGINLQSDQQIENQIVKANIDLENISQIKEFVSSKNDDDFIPGNIGITDNSISTTTQQYNQLMMEKKRLLDNSSTEKNPIVVNINEQLKSLKNNITEGLNSLESSQKISIEALNRQDARISSRLYSVPKQERQYRTIQRQQQIKEALFLYLLQKREETAITLGVAEANAQIIDNPMSSPNPISPKKPIIYMAAILIGLIIPFTVVYAINFLDTKISNREEVERLLNIPVLGDIPKIEGKKRFLITKNDISSVAEAFRILRTNLGFLLANTGNNGKTIFVTSTIAHEGKSFVASNLAASIGYAGKKTLLLGMDIRAPKIKAYLGIRGSKGVTNYIVDENLTLEEITVNVPKVENLDLISSGELAPNPAELLMHPRVKELFDQVKKKYDYIIVDTAASSIITDTTLLREYADVFVYVIRANYLDKRYLSYVRNITRDNRFPNLALLINGVEKSKGGYNYGYGYGTEFERSKSKKWWKKN